MACFREVYDLAEDDLARAAVSGCIEAGAPPERCEEAWLATALAGLMAEKGCGGASVSRFESAAVGVVWLVECGGGLRLWVVRGRSRVRVVVERPPN